MKLIFYGSSSFSISVLESLQRQSIVPSGIITVPDAPQGRGRIMQPNVVAAYATKHGIPFIAPIALRGEKGPRAEAEIRAFVSELSVDVALVASYGKIIPKAILDIPARGTLNIHPSLLPKYRGPSPLQSMILANEHEIGASIMLLDEEMDHGPIIARKTAVPMDWPMIEEAFEAFMAEEGATLFAQSVAGCMTGATKAEPQDHAAATYTRKFSKEDGRIDFATLSASRDEHLHAEAFRRFCAFHRYPGCWFVDNTSGGTSGNEGVRDKITDAAMIGGTFTPLRVVPEGRRDMPYGDYLRGKK